MRYVMLTLLCAAAAGCATGPYDETPRAARQECKAVAVYSGSEAIRNEVRGTARTDTMARNEGAMGVGRTKLDNPPELRSPPGTGVLNDAARDC